MHGARYRCAWVGIFVTLAGSTGACRESEAAPFVQAGGDESDAGSNASAGSGSGTSTDRDASTGGTSDGGVTGVGDAAADGGGSGAGAVVHHAGVRELPEAGAPRRRREPQAVWTGSEMIVFGGGVYTGEGSALGGRYDPKSRSWSPLPEKNAPCFRSSDEYLYASHGVWTGDELVIWCGTGDDHAGGGRYVPGDDAWTPISETGAPNLAPAVWTGDAMLVFGDYLGKGAKYDPAADAWSPMAEPTALSLGEGATLVWTGSVLLVWGGADGSDYTNAGGVYDPKTDSWKPMATVGAPSPRSLHTAVWTGTKMIVWGGYDGSDARLGDGGVYDPVKNAWTAIAADADVSGRERHTAVWSGTEMIVWGGAHGPPYPTDKARYDPKTGTWGVLDDPDYRYEHCAVWTGASMIAWGGVAFGESDVYRSGIVYTP